MRLRTVSFLWGFVISLVIFLGHFLYSTYILNEGFRALEKRHVSKQIKTANNIITDITQQLDRFVWDWASWDDTYRFVQDHNQKYLDSNLPLDTFIDQHLNGIVILNAQGTTVYARAVTDEGDDAPGLLSSFLRTTHLSLPVLPDEGSGGTFRVGNQYFVVAARPILTSDGEGPAQGTFFMFKRLSKQVIASVAKLTQLRISLQTPEESQTYVNILAGSAEEQAVVSRSSDTVVGCTFIPTIASKRGALLCVTSGRDIFQYGQRVIASNTVGIAIAVLALLFLFFILINSKFLKRLEGLGKQIVAIRKGERHHVRTGGTDEITDVAQALNELLHALEESHQAQMAQANEIAASERFLQQIFNSIPVGLMLVDPQSRKIMDINDFGLKLAGRTRKEVVGSVCHRQICPAEKDNCPILDLKQSRDFSRRNLLTATGELLPIMKSVSFVTQNDQELLLETFFDISELEKARKELEEIKNNLEETVIMRTEELEAANQELIALDKAKTLFLSSASHELRTPLTSMLGFIKLMRKQFDSSFRAVLVQDTKLEPKAERFAENLNIVHSEAERLGRLVTDLLDLNKIESRRMEWRDEKIAVNALLQHVSETFEGQASEKLGVEFKVRLSETPLKIHADQDRIQQVIINLLNNAYKFTNEGYVALSAHQKADMVVFEVADTGKGIPKSDVNHIFDLFYQVSDENRRSSQELGTGLGLAICQQIVTHYGGTIGVESEENYGSTFRFTIPMA